jgi:lysophospholipase L1-like esterase
MRKIIKLVLFNFVLAVAIIIFFEVALRLIKPLDKGSLFQIISYGGGQQLKIPRPHSTGIRVGKKVIINSLGFRGKEITLKKPSNTIRILLLGDSYVFGYGLTENETLSSVLQEKIDKEISSSTRIEIINGAVPGYNTLDEYLFLKLKGITISPDIVLLFYFTNDIFGYEPASLDYKFAELERKQDFKESLRRYFLTFNVVYCWYKAYLQNIIPIPRIFLPIDDNIQDSAGFKASCAALKDAANYLKEKNIKFAVFQIPTLTSTKHYPYLKLHQALKNFCEEEKINYFDFLAAFKDRSLHRLWITFDNEHTNRYAHEIMAAAILQRLIEWNYLRSEGEIDRSYGTFLEGGYPEA